MLLERQAACARDQHDQHGCRAAFDPAVWNALGSDRPQAADAGRCPGTLLLAWPLFRLLQHQERFALMLAGQLGFAILISMFAGSEAAASAEAFARPVRCSGVAFSHNLCMALLGGCAPMVATYLLER